MSESRVPYDGKRNYVLMIPRMKDLYLKMRREEALRELELANKLYKGGCRLFEETDIDRIFKECGGDNSIDFFL